jgi:hypothetical protein
MRRSKSGPPLQRRYCEPRTPSCRSNSIPLHSCQCSTAVPPSKRTMSIPVTTIDLFVGGTPMNSPVWVPRIVNRAATRSPSPITSSDVNARSGKAVLMAPTICFAPSRYWSGCLGHGRGTPALRRGRRCHPGCRSARRTDPSPPCPLRTRPLSSPRLPDSSSCHRCAGPLAMRGAVPDRRDWGSTPLAADMRIWRVRGGRCPDVRCESSGAARRTRSLDVVGEVIPSSLSCAGLKLTQHEYCFRWFVGWATWTRVQ